MGRSPSWPTTCRISGPSTSAWCALVSRPRCRRTPGPGRAASRKSGWRCTADFVEVKDNQVIMLASAAELASEVERRGRPPGRERSQPSRVSADRGQPRSRGRRRPALGAGPSGGRLRLTPASRRRPPPGLWDRPWTRPRTRLLDAPASAAPAPAATSTAALSARQRTPNSGIERHTQGGDAERHVGDAAVAPASGTAPGRRAGPSRSRG